MKKVLKYTGISLLTLIVIILLIPVFFKSKILAAVKSGINENIEAKVDFKDLGISWFSNFPKLTISLEDVSVEGINEFKGDTLLSAKSFDASVNIMSIIRQKDMKIYGVFLESPRIYALVNKEGKANWEITKEDSTVVAVEEPSSFQFNLEKYAVSNGYVLYNDEEAGMRAEISGLNHEGSGNFNQDLFTLVTKTNAGEASFSYAGIPYLINAKTGIDADIEINNTTGVYGFKNASLQVNELKLMANGFFQIASDTSYNMDISFDAPSNEFKHILSLVPAVYKNDFDKLKTSGTASFKGFVKGTYSENRLPAYSVDLGIKDGLFQYPDLPKPVQNIQVNANFSNVDGHLDNTIVDIRNAHLEFGDDPFDFKLLFKNPETIKYLDFVVKGKLNLAEITKFIKLDPGTSLSGLLDADAYAKGNLAAIESRKGPFNAGGFFNIRSFNFSSKELPFPLTNGSFDISLQNSGGVAESTSVNVSKGHIELGKDIFDFALQLRDPVNAMAFSGNAKGRLSLDKISQFSPPEPGTSISGLLKADMKFSGSKSDIDKGNYEKLVLDGNASVENVKYISKDYPEGVEVNAANLSFNPSNAVLHSLKMRFLGTNISADGVLNNMIAYALDKGALKGSVNLQADNIKLNDWMGADTAATATTSTGAFLVPANMDLTINAKANSVVYDKVDYRNVSGSLQLKNETVELRNVNTEALGGQMNFNGSYSTLSSKTRPDIKLDYSIKEIDVQKAFLAFNTVQKLMPVAQFLSGKLSSSFSMNGKLGEDMFPVLNSLTGKGNMLLLEGVLNKFQPLEKLANLLNVNALKDISLKDVQAQFEFTNGKVLVKPFDLKVRDIVMQVGGTHGLDQTMDYIIAMKIPRSYLGTAGNNLVNNLASAASQKGIPVTLSDVIDLNVRMTGSMNNPNIKTDLKQAAGDIKSELKQQASDFVQQKADSAKKTITDTINKKKDELIEKGKQELFNKITGKKDTASSSSDSSKQKTGDKIKGALKGLFKN